MIRLEKIEKAFGGNPVLKKVDVAIAEGSVTALIGPSGSGKSTLLRCVNLLETPDRGTLSIGPETVHFQPGQKLGREQRCCACASRPAWCSRTSSCSRTRP